MSSLQMFSYFLSYFEEKTVCVSPIFVFVHLWCEPELHHSEQDYHYLALLR